MYQFIRKITGVQWRKHNFIKYGISVWNMFSGQFVKICELKVWCVLLDQTKIDDHAASL